MSESEVPWAQPRHCRHLREEESDHADVQGGQHRLLPSSPQAHESELTISEFLRTYAPRIAYANPTLAFAVERIRDPRTKTVNPNNPNKGAEWENGEQPGSTMVVELGE